MRNRINELLNGRFEYSPVKVELSDKTLSGQVNEQENCRGRFALRTQDAIPVQGFVCSTNPRVEVRPEHFVSGNQSFRFEADTKGLKAGDMLEGSFIISTTSGELRLPYEIGIRGTAVREATRESEVITVEEFAELARKDFSKAYVLFLSRDFAGILKEWGPLYETLYEGICSRTVTFGCLEQFLIGCGMKERCVLSLDSDTVFLPDMAGTSKEEITVNKNTWGFSVLRITSDAPFLVIERPEVTTDEFVGSVYHLGFIVHRELMHPGRNFARIRISCEGQELICTVEVRPEKKSLTEHSLHRRKKALEQMMLSYIDHRADKITAEDWTAVSLKMLDQYRNAGGSHFFFDLYEIYLLFQKEDTIQAQILLQQAGEREEELKDPAWKGFHLYLTSLQSQDEEYLEYVKTQIGALFLENQENWILQWLILRINPRMYRNDTERLDCIRRLFFCGCTSPVLYMDAYDILKKEPLQLRTLEKFEVRLLAFLSKNKLIDRELSGQTAHLASRCREFDPVLFRVLTQCFDHYPTKNLLTAICTMLLQGKKNSPEYAKWYAQGIRQDIRLTGLYEYFAETAGDLENRMLPQSVRMYFNYHNTLDHGRKAVIYANIVRNRTRDPGTYETYRDEITRFMEEQLVQGRVNRDLALLYEVLLTKELMTEPLAKGLEKVLFTSEITCPHPQMRHVIAVHRALKREQRVPMTKSRGYIQIFSPDCSVLLEDEEGTRYAADGLCRMERLLTREVFADYCMEYLDQPSGFLLKNCAAEGDRLAVTAANLEQYVQMLGLSNVKISSRDAVRRELIRYYYQHPQAEYLEKFLSLINVQEAAVTQKKEIAALLAECSRYEDLYSIIRTTGAERIDTEICVRLCSYLIRESEEIRDPGVLSLCGQCFGKGLYDERILEYLMQHFEGPADTMKAVWDAGRAFKLDSFVLEERILVLLLFLQEKMEHTEEIFASYRLKAGKSRICQAYAARMAYNYFVKEQSVTEPVFSYIEQMLGSELLMPEVCRMALLKHYVEDQPKNAAQEKLMEALLEHYTGNGMRFAFLHKLPRKLKQKYYLNDKFIVECRTRPGSEVILHYRCNKGAMTSVCLADTFEGIYTKEFTLFYMDTLEWYFTVEENGVRKDTIRQTVSYQPGKDTGMSRYDLINRMIEAKEAQDEEKFMEIKEKYMGLQYLVDEIFDMK